MEAGKPFSLKPGHILSIRRIEGGMLSYYADTDTNKNPFELGLDRLVDLKMDVDFIGKSSLKRIKADDVHRKQVGLVIEGAPLKGPSTVFWPVKKESDVVGKVTSAVYSPRLKQNIALAMVSADLANVGEDVEVHIKSVVARAWIVERPFHDPKKTLAAAEQFARIVPGSDFPSWSAQH